MTSGLRAVQAGSGPDAFPWWREAERLASEIPAGEPPVPTAWYGMGDAFLGIRSDDSAFAERFRDVYGDSLGAAPGAGDGPVLGCAVRAHPARPFAMVTFADPEPLDPVPFVTELFAPRGYADRGTAGPWRVVGVGSGGDAHWAFAGARILVRRDADWQGLVANCAVHRAVRLQRGVLFLHAASVAVAGRGVLLVGAKGSGKTTLSLTLAAQGHGFLGDEIGAVRLARRELLPVPRSVSVRHGPRAARVDRRLSELRLPTVRLPDGSERVRARPSAVVPGVVRGPVPLGAIVFLDGFAAVPAVERVELRRDLFGRLNPLGSTLWGVSPAERVYRIADLMQGPALFRLRAGAPEETAGLLTATLESLWA